MNPFFAPSELPYDLPPFDRIADEHYLPAFERGMAEHQAEIDAIAANSAPTTFDNTVVALERSGRLLERVSRVFFAKVGADTNPDVQRLEAEIAPRLAAHRDGIYLNAGLSARVAALYDERDELGLDPESRWLLERYRLDFVRAGAQLSEADQSRLRELNQQLASLMAEFGQNLLAESNDLAVVVDDPAELAGLSEDAIAAAKSDQGSYVLNLRLFTNQPELAWLHDRDLRERIYQAAVDRGLRGNDNDNRELVRRIVSLRAEHAQLLGYDSHAAYVIDDTTAGSVEAVAEMLGRIVPAAVANARAEAADLQAAIDAAGETFTLQPWDWSYYAERVRRQRYDLDVTALRSYFELERVLRDGVFYAAERLYGLTFTERPDLPTYHPDARTFEVFDSGVPLGLFVADLYTRESKRGGAWMTSFVQQAGLLDSRPVVVINLNVSQPPADEPTLLALDEVRTLFHEFGHALHGLLSDVTYPKFSGTSVPRDFVEYPSQVNEMWMLWPEVLSNYAEHFRTGAPLPDDVVERLREARTFDEGYATTEYLAATLLDQAWHQLGTADLGDGADTAPDVEAFEARALEQAGVALPYVPPRYRTTYFSHVFGNAYSARYYSYIWSEVLDADSVQWFEENGGLLRENGDHFRRALLSRGGSVDAMAAFREFRGREPRIEPLLARRGLDG